MSSPRVSVVIPTFNRAHTITAAINSVLEQTYREFEIVVVDDGSTDQTAAVIAAIDDPRVRYHAIANGGASNARNVGVRHAQSEWIMYLDSDDTLLPNCIEVMMRWLSENPHAVFSIPRSERTLELYENGRLIKTIDDSGDTPPEFSVQDIFDRNAGFSCNGFMHRRTLFDEGIQWDPDCSLMEDWELMLQIANAYPEGFLYVPVVLQRYTQRFGSDNLVSQTSYGDWADAFEYIYQKHKNDPLSARQHWYPAKVDKWRARQAEYERGERGPYYLHYFS